MKLLAVMRRSVCKCGGGIFRFHRHIVFGWAVTFYFVILMGGGTSGSQGTIIVVLRGPCRAGVSLEGLTYRWPPALGVSPLALRLCFRRQLPKKGDDLDGIASIKVELENSSADKKNCISEVRVEETIDMSLGCTCYIFS